MRAKDSGSDEIQTSMIMEVLAPLSEVVMLEAQEATSVSHEISMMNTIPMFFEYALKLLPQDTPKQRMTEAPWLRALFIQLNGCISLRFPLSEVSTLSEDVLDTLEALLRLLVENNVSVDTPILESIVLHLSGIDPVEAQHHVKWSLIGLCMEICPDLAIPVRPNSNLRTGRATSKSNMVLNRMLDKLTDSGFRDRHEISSDYQVMLDTVVLRLLKSFINARDLLGYFKIWEKRIELWETANESNSQSGAHSPLASSIWEDETLLQAISEQLEQVLTAGQITKFLDDLDSRIANGPDALKTNSPESYAQFVVLDCVLNGARSDSLKIHCRVSIESISRKLAACLRTNKTLIVQHRWRIWRVLATVASRFSYQDDLFRDATDTITLSLAQESNSSHLLPHYYEALFALSFLIAIQEVQNPGSQHEERSEILSAVIRAFAESAPSVSLPDKEKDSVQPSHWDGRRESITSRETFLFACTAQLISMPRVLRYCICMSIQCSR